MNCKPLIFFLLFVRMYSVLAQNPTAQFTVPPSACLQQRLDIHNLSSNASSYAWDFCLGDMQHLQNSFNFSVQPTINFGVDYKLVHDAKNWFAFILSENNNHLIRLDFGSDQMNTPTVVDLGNPGNMLSQPEGFDIINSNGNWYAFVGHFDANYGVVMLSFGNSLQNFPASTYLGNFGYSARIRDLKVVTQGTNNILILSNYSDNSIVRVNFGTSITNPSPTVIDSGPIAGITLPMGMDLVNTGSAWVLQVVSYLTNTLVQLNFGADLLSTPVVAGTYNFIGVNNPYKLRLFLEGDTYYSIVSNAAQSLDVINFNDLNPANAPQELTYSGMPSLIGFDVFRYKGQSIVQGIGSSDNLLKQLVFESICGATVRYSTAAVPQVSYTQPGTDKIELVASSATQQQSQLNQVVVSSSISPDIFSSSDGNICAGNPVNFSSNTSGSIAFYSWDFGDSNTGSGSSVSHIYTAGTYHSRLSVTGTNGCSNFTELQLSIYNPPQANFTLPSANPICSNQNYTFTNTSTFDSGSNPSWQWSVNGNNVATSQDLSYRIASASSQTVALTASIPGCSTQATKTIVTVLPGPLVDFNSSSTGCVSSSIQFANATTGATTGYSWTFGDGNTSTQTSPTNSYLSTGQFAVTLTASNALGCQNYATKSISIYSNPQPDFAVEAPPFSCANYPAQFDNNTPALSDSNISTWIWNFGDAANGTSSQKNPAYTFTSSSSYNVTLHATTNFGCTGTTQKTILISPSPQAGFNNSPACVNQSTQFTDASSGNIITYQWSIEGNILSGSSIPSYVFKAAGTYPVALTVFGNSGCQNQVTKSINVPVPPVMDFTIQAPCTGNATIFQELNPNGPDPSIAWNWNFGQASGTGSPVNYTFSSPGGYSVTLNSTRKSGCVYSVSKNIVIYNGPVAQFTPSVQAGAAPLEVNFNNSSTADLYRWQFGDSNNSTSNLVSPTFIYTQLGKYKVLLTASNNYGCSDTLSSEINVVIPRIDLSMNNFILNQDPASSSSKAVVTIFNAGNIPFTNPNVEIDLAGGALLKETVFGVVQPGKSITQTLSLEIIPQAIEYICALVVAPSDQDIDNDKKCIPLTNADNVFTPYPNPSSGKINLDWISAASETVYVTIYKSTGAIAYEQEFPMVQVGLVQLSINTSELSNGLYLIRYSGAKTQKSFSIIVAN